MDSLIHENGITLSKQEREYLTQTSKALNEQIYFLMKAYPDRGFTTQELQATLESVHGVLNKDSIRRGTTQQTDCDSGHPDYKDEYDRFRLIKSEEKRLNPESQVHIHVYKINPRFGKPLSHEEIKQKNMNRQQNFHADLFGG